MNNKKNRKDAASASNNNYKTKSKIINAEGEIATTNKPTKVGRKRKQQEADVDIPTAKKSRKKVREQTSLNNTGAQDIEPSGMDNSFNIKNEETEETVVPKRTKKKSKISTSDQHCYSSADQSNSAMNRKNKPNQTANVSMEGTNPSFHNVDALGRANEVFPMKYSTLDIQDKLSDIEIKEEEPEEELLGSDIAVTITTRDLETDSDLSDTESFEDLDKTVKVEEMKGERSEALKIMKNITWPEEDLKILVDRMDTCIPENDILAFTTRAEKLEWDVVAFKGYTVEECKNTWHLLQKQIRKFRLLKEVLGDAREWINLPKYKRNKSTRHPDMPRKPLSAYIIYYLKKKGVFHKTHPGLEATEISKILGQEFKSLPPDKRLKYENLAATKKAEYLQKMNEFYQAHPDVPRIMKVPRIRKNKTPKPAKLPKPVKQKPPPKVPKERTPKRPPPPFQYYYLSEVKAQKETGEQANKLEFKEVCKERWKQLPDKKKLTWINFAEAEYAKYEEELKIYMQNHPDYVHSHQKPILTKEEIQIKDRVAGKPSKPPGSAYNLFARMLLQSDEVKNVPVRDRLNFVSNQWKNCPDEEKKQYKDLSAKLNEKYKLDFASYLETLPEEERKLELQKSLPKRRKSEVVEKKRRATRKKKSFKKPERKIVPKKLLEPEQPPISAYKYFATLYSGEDPAVQAWRALTSEQKKIYEGELVKKKQAYIADFEKFLKSLTKEELEAFSNSRRKMKDDDDDDDDDEESSDESGTGESDVDSNDADEESDN